ncbi:MAG: hypothetical protein R3F62_09415 [Planctomycetota bacterium]
MPGDPYATPRSELQDPPNERARDRARTARVFALLNLGLGAYLGYELLRVVLPGIAAARVGRFTWDLALYGGLLLLPLAFMGKGLFELGGPLWRRAGETHPERT